MTAGTVIGGIAGLLIIAFSKWLDIAGGNMTFRFQRDLKKAHAKAVKQPKDIGASTLIGTTGRKNIYIPDKSNHVFVCGTTGSGKTVALTNFFKSGIEKGYPMLIIDGKGDRGQGSIMDFICKHKGSRKLYVIDMNDPEKSDKYNPFQNANPTIIKDMIINLTIWTEEHYKANTERYLQRVIDLMLRSGETMDLENIVAHVPHDKFLELSMSLTKKGTISREEHIGNVEIADTSGKIAESASARFATLIESEIGRLFAPTGIDIRTAIKEKAIILFILNPLIYPETTRLFGNLIIIDSKKAVGDLQNNKQERVFFIFDEINVYASTNMLDLVNKSRSANVSCILACQSLSDLDASVSEYFRGQVIENCNNYVILRQNNADNAEVLANTIGTREGIDASYQVSENGATGLGSIHRNREFYYHPDDIKRLKEGEAIILLKDTGFHSKVKINFIQ